MTDFNDIALARHLREQSDSDHYWASVDEIMQCYGMNQDDAIRKLADDRQNYLDELAAERYHERYGLEDSY